MNQLKMINHRDAFEIGEQIRKGKTLILPTDTSYGLCCNAYDQEAVDEVFAIKGREKNKPLLITVDCMKNAKKHLLWTATIDKLTKKYWPGPLTIVSKCVNQMFANGIVNENGEVAVRMPAHKMFRKIIAMTYRPVVATSANLSGEPEIFDSKEAFKIFSERVIYPNAVMNFGKISKNIPTTMIRVDVMTDEITILRQGKIIPNLDLNKMQRYFGRFVKKKV